MEFLVKITEGLKPSTKKLKISIVPPKLKKLPGAALKIGGNTIGTFDMMIAAHARSRDMVLVINNERHF